jgi:tetratricopeptide (TPR) repeat protein
VAISRVKDQQQLAVFAIIPLTTLLLFPNLLDTNGLPKLIALIFGTIVLVTKIRIRFKKSLITFLPVLLALVYLISQIVVPNNLDKFLIGSYGRAGGFISLGIFVIIFMMVSMNENDLMITFRRVLYFTYICVLLFGLFQYFDLLPFRLTKEFNALSLSVGNPNFASALLGIMISAHLVTLVFDKSAKNWLSIAIFLAASIELILIKSLQGYLIVILALICIISLKYRSIIKNIHQSIRIIFAIVIFLTGISVYIFTPIGNWIYQNGSVHNRLAYWKLSFEIFRDHILLGVGIDNLRSYILQYRDLEMALQEGVFTIPDRSHNVFIDHFVNGGVFAGLIWLTFVVGISYFAIKIIRFQDEIDSNLIVLIIVWIGYITQSFISVDHLSLTLIGFVSAGLINYKWIEIKSSGKIESKNRKESMYIRGLTLVFAFASFIYSMSFLPAEYKAGQYYFANKIETLEAISKSSRIQAQTLEKVMVKLSQIKQFELANDLADKMLKLSPDNHQAYYVKSVYQESIGNNPVGREWMYKAHKADKWNPVYLLSLAIYDYKLGNFEQAQKYLNEAEAINPNQQGLTIVKKLILK